MRLEGRHEPNLLEYQRGVHYLATSSGSIHFVGSGRNNDCAIRTDGTAVCWGHDAIFDFTPPDGVFTAVSVGYGRACGLRLNNTVDCWGKQIEK